MFKYKVYDIYEGKEVVGYADTLEDCRKLAKEWSRETDGECCIVYAELNEETQKYKFSQYKALSY